MMQDILHTKASWLAW